VSGISRRRFLTGLGAATGAAVAAGYGLTVWQSGDRVTSSAARAHRPAPGSARGRTDRTLVVVELGGGNDGLSTVVPVADPAYASLRPTLAVADAIALDGSVGLHPKLVKLAGRYRAGQVAIVEGVGFPDPDLSHFASLARWWAGTPDAGDGTGWIGRYLDATVGYEDPLAAIGIGPVPSPALAGAASFATSIADTSGLAPSLPAWVDSPDELVAAWSAFAPASPDPATLLGQVQHAIDLTVEARAGLDADLREVDGPASATDELATAQANGRDGAVASSLRLAAELVTAPHPPRVIYVSGLGDYDEHEGLATRHPVLMSDLDAGIDTFFTTLDAKGATSRALVITVSEFGRRPAENGSGTDHGTAAPHFLVGPGVKGGRYGAPPSLTQLDPHGNLVATTDPRVLYATAVQGWLGVDATAIVGNGFAPLPIVS
jgi:uncharacterized protein (DUF1501 family)